MTDLQPTLAVYPRFVSFACLASFALIASFAPVAVRAADSADAAETTDAPDAAPRLELAGNVFRFDGHSLRFMDRIETWTAVLGSPTRTTDSPTGTFLHWDSLGLEVGGPRSVDGRIYVAHVRVWLKDAEERWTGVPLRGFPGVFLLQGATLGHGENRFDWVKRALPAETPLVGRGQKVFEDAMISLPSPDGFKVNVWAPLHCASSSGAATASGAANDSCPLVFDELTIEALFCCAAD